MTSSGRSVVDGLGGLDVSLYIGDVDFRSKELTREDLPDYELMLDVYLRKKDEKSSTFAIPTMATTRGPSVFRFASKLKAFSKTSTPAPSVIDRGPLDCLSDF